MQPAIAPAKARRPHMTARRAAAIAHVADKLRPQSDARVGHAGLFGVEREHAAQVCRFIEWADELQVYRRRKGIAP